MPIIGIRLKITIIITTITIMIIRMVTIMIIGIQGVRRFMLVGDRPDGVFLGVGDIPIHIAMILIITDIIIHIIMDTLIPRTILTAIIIVHRVITNRRVIMGHAKLHTIEMLLCIGNLMAMPTTDAPARREKHVEGQKARTTEMQGNKKIINVHITHNQHRRAGIVLRAGTERNTITIEAMAVGGIIVRLVIAARVAINVAKVAARAALAVASNTTTMAVAADTVGQVHRAAVGAVVAVNQAVGVAVVAIVPAAAGAVVVTAAVAAVVAEVMAAAVVVTDRIHTLKIITLFSA